MPNLQAIIQYAKDEYGLVNPQEEKTIAEGLFYAINDLCKNFDYDFLRVLPSPYVPLAFPITTITDYALKETWIDQGWFYTVSGQHIYTFYSPAWTPTAPEYDSADLPEWKSNKVKGINSIMQYDYETLPATTSNIVPLTVLPYLDVLHNYLYDATPSVPEVCAIYQEGDYTKIVLAPIPDDTYLYAVDYTLSQFPVFLSPGATNPLFERYPKLAIVLALQIMAEHRKQYEDAKYHAEKIPGIIQGIKKENHDAQYGAGRFMKLPDEVDTRIGTRWQITVP